MKLPNLSKAVVPPQKITGYLLNREHPEGGDKCEFFVRFGFSESQWEALADALLKHAAQNEVVKSESTKYGVRYVIEGVFNTPDSRNPQLRSVWFTPNGEDSPRLVTAYRLRKGGTDD